MRNLSFISKTSGELDETFFFFLKKEQTCCAAKDSRLQGPPCLTHMAWSSLLPANPGHAIFPDLISALPCVRPVPSCCRFPPSPHQQIWGPSDSDPQFVSQSLQGIPWTSGFSPGCRAHLSAATSSQEELSWFCFVFEMFLGSDPPT